MSVLEVGAEEDDSLVRVFVRLASLEEGRRKYCALLGFLDFGDRMCVRMWRALVNNCPCLRFLVTVFASLMKLDRSLLAMPLLLP